MIAIIDYGMGNLRSAQRGLEKVGAQVRVVQSPRELSGARGLVLPGDGAFGRAMDNLRAGGWIEPLRNAAAGGVPFFGICVGMQLLFESSEEMGHHQGLGLFAGTVKRFTGNLKVPHMGWNQIRTLKQDGDSALLLGVADGGYCYFVHSYYCTPEDASVNVATTDYGIAFASMVEHGNIFGTQFHPEKSQATGLKILENFVRITSQ